VRADGARNSSTDESLAARLDDALPQTQCRRCGYPSCRDYARAIAAGLADIDRCPPGGTEGIVRLSRLTGRPAMPLNPDCGAEGPRKVAWIVEAHCIGCTLCIAACPVDCIVGAPKRMHTVIESECTGCELCIPACPVDCIALDVATGDRSGWQAWSAEQALASQVRFRAREARREHLAQRHDEHRVVEARHTLDTLAEASTIADQALLERKRRLVEAALQRAQDRLRAPDKVDKR
jgi:Na+-translocating ferredoxin:NAD+ oxidoreductase subunit B